MGALPVVRSRPAGRGARAAARARLGDLGLPHTSRGLVVALASLLAVGLLLVPVGALAQIVLTAQVDDHSRTQAIVVMDSARSWGDPREQLDARLDHAAELYASGVAPVVIVTGPAKAGEHATQRLADAGVPARDVVALTSGADTVGSLQVVATVLAELGWQSVTLVTDPAQAARAGATASGFGIDAHLSPTEKGAGVGLSSDAVGREALALIRYYAITRPGQQPIVGR